LKSMTGFGSAKAANTKLDLEISIKTVNGRFLEFKPHIPRDFVEFESAIKSEIKSLFQRGSVDVYVNRRYKEGGKKITIESNGSLARAWKKEFVKIDKQLKLNSAVDLNHALRQFPDILKVDEQPVINAEIKKLLLSTVKSAAANCDKERAREGKALKKELLALLVQLQAQVEDMKRQKESALKSLETRYKERLKKLGMPEDADPQRIAQEIVVQVDKADIQEELTRLQEHMRAFKTLASKSGSIGKKLDFYTQELLREVNTIGSKSQVAKLTGAVVEAKSIIERIREQVQNIE